MCHDRKSFSESLQKFFGGRRPKPPPRSHVKTTTRRPTTITMRQRPTWTRTLTSPSHNVEQSVESAESSEPSSEVSYLDCDYDPDCEGEMLKRIGIKPKRKENNEKL